MGGLGCLDCKRKFARSRGLCDRCYRLARLAVKRGETSWSQLVARGLARHSDLELGKKRDSRFGHTCKGGTSRGHETAEGPVPRVCQADRRPQAEVV